MNRFTHKIFLLAVFIFLNIPQALSQSAIGALTGSSSLNAVAARVTSAPVLDGDIMNDQAYANVTPLTDFWQNRPDDGQSPTERTEVRIVYTADKLYFGIICHDRNPSEIIVSENRRDALLDETDCVHLQVVHLHYVPKRRLQSKAYQLKHLRT